MKFNIMLLFNLLLLFITVDSVLNNTTFRGDLPYALELSIYGITLISVILFKKTYFNKENATLLWPVKLFLIWNIISVTRGIFVAENYWEWKNLVSTSFVFAIPIFVYIFTNKLFVQKIISFWLKYTMPWILALIPFVTMTDLYGSFLAPILLLLLLFPIIPLRWKILVLFFTFIVLTIGVDSRSNIIRFSFAALLGFLYYFKWFISVKMLKIAHVMLILLPIVLLILGLTNVFNPFKMNEYIKGDLSVARSSVNNKFGKENLKADTRTFIYVETITSALKHDYVALGRTPANGYDSKSFGNFLKFILHTGKLQRFSSEVAILNIFTWNGLVGVFLYFLVFFMASFLAIYRSNSYFMRIIGLFVAFRWSYAFVEDFTVFNIQYIMLWLFISMCYSIEFRKMNDVEFNKWVKDLLPMFVYNRKY